MEYIEGSVCENHRKALADRLHTRIRFYETDNTPVLGHVTLCEAHLTGCVNPATHRFEILNQGGQR